MIILSYSSYSQVPPRLKDKILYKIRLPWGGNLRGHLRILQPQVAKGAISLAPEWTLLYTRQSRWPVGSNFFKANMWPRCRQWNIKWCLLGNFWETFLPHKIRPPNSSWTFCSWNGMPGTTAAILLPAWGYMCHTEEERTRTEPCRSVTGALMLHAEVHITSGLPVRWDF